MADGGSVDNAPPRAAIGERDARTPPFLPPPSQQDTECPLKNAKLPPRRTASVDGVIDSAVPTSRMPRAVGEDGEVADAAAGGKAAPRQTRGRARVAGTRASSKAAEGVPTTSASGTLATPWAATSTHLEPVLPPTQATDVGGGGANHRV